LRTCALFVSEQFRESTQVPQAVPMPARAAEAQTPSFRGRFTGQKVMVAKKTARNTLRYLNGNPGSHHMPNGFSQCP
jgi:hypothetical protein